MAVLTLLSLALFIITFLGVNNNGQVEASHQLYPQFQSLTAINVLQLHRTAFHFQPPQNWINGCFFLCYSDSLRNEYVLFICKNMKGARIWDSHN
ncbi:hypothetical protein V6N13_072904 [Hibiscus sabdariffa]